MGLQQSQSRALFQRAAKVMPLGVNSNFRYWGPDDTLIFRKGEGAYVWDADDRRYIDYRLAFGPVILGHAYPPVLERVRQALESGNLFAGTTPAEVEVAERITRLCKVDKVRLTSSGTEATMHALRLARAYTGREKFIKFEGNYHGQADYFMFSTATSPAGALGSARSPVPAPSTSGIPKGMHGYVITLPFNDLERLEERVEAVWGDLAAIIVEPIMGNSCAVMPRPGWLEKLRELCDRYRIVLIFDEVKTGFRIAKGGAQEYFGVQADLVTYAKALGNGFPIAAFAGKEGIMRTIEAGGVAHAGTYSGNAVGTAAALATLDLLENEPVLETIRQRGQMLMSGIGEVLRDAGLPHSVQGSPAMFGILLGSDQTPSDYRDCLQGDAALYKRITFALAERGVLAEPDFLEAWYLSYSHSEQDVAETLTALEQAVRAAK